MRSYRSYYPFCFVLVLMIAYFQNTGCIKEYSFEGADTAATAPDTATIPVDTVRTFPQCGVCTETDDQPMETWSFKTGNAFVCGSCTSSGFFDGNTRTAFTFFGPSACSVDTGIVVSVYLAAPLVQDSYNIVTNSTAFYYYDHNAPKDIFISGPPYTFTVTIQSYSYETGIATGTFYGTVLTATGGSAVISGGKFKIRM